MVDRLYAEPALVGLYDVFNAADQDLIFYKGLIGAAPGRVLDLGCGTGRLAVSLAAAGHEVVGVDPAPRMLDVARRRPGGAMVRWIEGDASALPPGLERDVVLMTGHAFQCLLADDAVSSTLAAARRVLPPGGRLMFESRNPLVRAWERWGDTTDRQPAPKGYEGMVSVRHTVLSVEGELVTFVSDYGLPQRLVRSRTTLRFMSRERIDQSLHTQGFRAITHYGDWSGAAWRPDSPEIITVAA